MTTKHSAIASKTKIPDQTAQARIRLGQHSKFVADWKIRQRIR